MSMVNSLPRDPAEMTRLLSNLSHDLSPSLDPCGLCTAFAQGLADLGIAAAVALLRADQDVFLVWLAEPHQGVSEGRWQADDLTANALVAARGLQRHDPSDLQREEGAGAKGAGSELALRSQRSVASLALPYPVSENDSFPPGLVALFDPPEEPGLWQPSLELVAQQLTLHLARALLREHIDRQSSALALLTGLSHSITTAGDLRESLLETTDQLRRALDADSVSVGLLDEAGQELVFVGELMGPLFQDLPPLRLRMGQGVAGWVAQHGQPAIVNNPYDDRRFFDQVDRESGFRTTSILCAPLAVERRTIGVLEALNKRGGEFGEGDLVQITAVSGPLALLIDHTRLQERAMAEAARTEVVLETMAEGLLIANQSGQITAANDGLRSLLKSADAGLVGSQLLDVIRTGPTDFAAFVRRVMVANGAGQAPELAADLVQAGGTTIPVHIAGRSVPDKRGEPADLLFVFTDLSDVMEVERLRDDFFDNVINELHMPLATILMYARLLRKGHAAGNDAKAQRFLSVIERESDRLQKMIVQMLQMTRVGSAGYRRSPQPVNLKAVFDEVLGPLADQATQKGLTFRRRIPDDLPPVVSTDETARMVFRNLIENSVRYSLSGTIVVTAGQEGEQVRVEIVDEGIGISAASLPNVFRRFYPAQPALERGLAGSGLGLYMAKLGLNTYGGQIEIESEEDHGTRVVVRLPVAMA
jgi:two-component system, OmpR family, phosphate regulon sensor histidine kinase PhoR